MRRLCADQIMATPQPTEMQVEGEIGVEKAVKEMLEIEVLKWRRMKGTLSKA